MPIGIIGGSGLYDIEGLQVREERKIETPFGEASGKFIIAELEGRELVFLARHGAGHKLMPHELNHKANIWAMKKLGVESIISLSAVGSLKEEIKPLDFVLVDQYVDNTRRENQTFFGNGAVAHVSLADPVCGDLRSQITSCAQDLFVDEGIQIHSQGTYLNMQGPAFSTRAESNLYRSWGMDVVGMTNFCEARLAREAEICYATVAMVTDYDCWHDVHEAVTVEQVIDNLMKNAARAKQLIKNLIPKLDLSCEQGCRHALKSGLLTPFKFIPEETAAALEPLIGKYK